MRSKRGTGVLQERKRKLPRFAHSVHTSTNRAGHFREIFRASVGQFLPFDVPPKCFDRVEIQSVARQSLYGEPEALVKEVFLHDLALVGGQAVPDPNRFSPSQLLLQILQDADEGFAVVASLPHLEVKAAAPPIAAVARAAQTDTFGPLKAWIRTGVWPFGAQVRRTEGRCGTPLSSGKKIQAWRRRAFFLPPAIVPS